MVRTAITAGCLLAIAVLPFTACVPASAPRPVSTGCTTARQIALTFDDGPNPGFTEQFLDILADRNARATFFVTGQTTAAAPAIVKREVAAGMAIGAHSFDHRRGLERLSPRNFLADLQRADEAIAPAAGSSPTLFRAPFGHWSRTMLETLEAHGYVPIGWDVDSRDWDPETQPDDIVRNVISNAHPGAMVLLHDGGLSGGDPDRRRTLEALPQIIDALQRDGYELVTVPELVGAEYRSPCASLE